jgi:hypothetical protein
MSSVYGSKGDYRKALEYAQKGFKLKKENDPDYYQGFL